MKIDFHSHILPGIDDGAKNVEQSLEMLRMLYDDGVDIVALTPHMYLHKQDIDGFLCGRDEAAKLLTDAISSDIADSADADTDVKYPKLLLGAEVYFHSALSRLPIEKLVLENTRYIMVELPYQKFSTSFVNDFSDFADNCGVKIILAHVERYFEYNDYGTIESILDNDVLLAQFNCDVFEHIKSRALVCKLIKSGLVQLMGTDAHNTTSRSPKYMEAERFIRKKTTYWKKIEKMSEMVINDCPIDEIMQICGH